MSDLQIGLMMLGAAIVAAVLGYNWWQEKQFRRRVQNNFGIAAQDVLLEVAKKAPEGASRGSGRTDARIEPSLDYESAAPPAGPMDAAERRPEQLLDYVADIHSSAPIPRQALLALRQDLSGFGKPVSFDARMDAEHEWEPLAAGESRFTAVRCAIQLVDRAGPISLETLSRFRDKVATAAKNLSATADIPEAEPALERAAELDRFCAEVDVQLGINVVARSGEIFAGSKVRALAEASGMKLQPGGEFQLHDASTALVYCLVNQQPPPFSAENIRNLTTPGVTFLLDVPRTRDGLATFERMVEASRSLADALDGLITDDNRAALNEAGLDKIREQLRSIYSSMEEYGIQAGGSLALRLFS
jgi:FtsZ-interacting cell division protein ZipA